MVFTINRMGRGEEFARGLFPQNVALLPDLNEVCGVGLSMCELKYLKLDTSAWVAWNVVGQVLSEFGLCGSVNVDDAWVTCYQQNAPVQ